jgi:translocation and assembly module TamA
LRPLAALLLACAASTAVLAEDPPRRAVFPVQWDAPEPLRSQLEKLLPPPAPEAGTRRGAVLRPWVRDVRRRVPEIAAAEGYFSATVDVEFEDDRESAKVTVVQGPRTSVSSVDIEFAGDIAQESEERARRRNQLRDGWLLGTGSFFRSGDWEEAKRALREKLIEEDYAAGDIVESAAEVDADAATARLRLKLDSGPRFTLGTPIITGLTNYPQAVLQNIVDVTPGERYRQERLLALQRSLQNGPWFASVVVEIDRDAESPREVPVRVKVIERPRREVGLAVGYGTDDGPRVELAYRDRNFFDRGLDLQSAVRVDGSRQFGYADLFFPQRLFGSWLRNLPTKDSLGVLAERTDIQNLETRRFAVAGYRQFTIDPVEVRVGLSYQIERSMPQGSEEDLKRALAPVVALTWRHVDDPFDPRRGGVLNVQFAAAGKALASTQDFLKAYGQYQLWIPLGAVDQVLLRGEIGRTFAPSREGIPEDFLSRAGGSRSVRGYEYQSLGVKDGDAIVGGRYLATGSAEYIHWFRPQWGGAVFLDVGDASDSVKDWEPNKGYGAGVRYKTAAGPLALDVAYAERDRKFRISFSVSVAF